MQSSKMTLILSMTGTTFAGLQNLVLYMTSLDLCRFKIVLQNHHLYSDGL
jgi:hypothetical protein